jgi:DNA-binding transcriptional LysR family regulator
MLGGLHPKQLEAFYWIAWTGSFSAAAARLHTTQPAVSARLRELEARLGERVFDRSHRGARLTAKGRELLVLVERLLALDREWQSRLGAGGPFAGLVRLGAADTVAMTVVPTLLARIGERHPNVDVELVVDLSIHLQARLREGEIDIAFIAGEMGSPDYTVRPLGEVENAWMCSPALGLPRRRLSAAELAQQPVLTHSRGSHLHHMVTRWFEAAGAAPNRLHGCNSLAMMIKLTVAGLGVSVLPVPLVGAELASGELRRVRVEEPVPPNRFVVTWSTTLVEGAVGAIADLAVEVAATSPAFLGVGRGSRRVARSRESDQGPARNGPPAGRARSGARGDPRVE